MIKVTIKDKEFNINSINFDYCYVKKCDIIGRTHSLGYSFDHKTAEQRIREAVQASQKSRKVYLYCDPENVTIFNKTYLINRFTIMPKYCHDIQDYIDTDCYVYNDYCTSAANKYISKCFNDQNMLKRINDIRPYAIRNKLKSELLTVVGDIQKELETLERAKIWLNYYKEVIDKELTI